ncbi:MAG: hypothetical protein INR73_01520 [Williamsia sp.]|nr:hypothetical protein [Williamsia sp.]
MYRGSVRGGKLFVTVLFFLQVFLLPISCKKGDPLPGSEGWEWDGIVVKANPKAVTKTNGQKLYVHYMSWFETPQTHPERIWGLHWTMANRNPDMILANGRRQIASYFYPLIGPYASSDPDVLDYHTLLMKYTGIDGAIVDWYGSHELFDYPLIRRNTDSLFDHLPRAGLKFAICYEDMTLQQVKQAEGMEPAAAAKQDFNYLQARYFGSSNYIKIGTQPLVLCFGPQVLQTEASWQQTFAGLATKPRLLTLWDLGSLPGSQGSGEFSWVYQYDADCQYFYQYKVPRLATAIGSAFPGFKSFYAEGGWGSPVFERSHNGTATLQRTLNLAKINNLAGLQLVTWNDFGEGTMLEPTLDFSYSFLEAIQRYAGVPYTKAELQLVYRWYMLRKKYAADERIQAALLQAYYFLVSLDVAKARLIVEAIE